MALAKAVLGSLLFVAATLSPLALAHNDPTPWALAGRVPGVATSTDGADRVSGVYYLDRALLARNLGPVVAGLDASAGVPVDVRMRDFYCDFEKVVWVSPPVLWWEPEIDGSPGGTLGTTLFNDGGIGSVCHTHPGYYPEAAYNTPGCGYAPAFAQDSSGIPVWLTTFCDYAHPTSGLGLATFFLNCITNYNLVGSLPVCIEPVLSCLMAQPLGCPLTDGMACGANENGLGTVRTVGLGGWGTEGVPFDAVPGPCLDVDGAALAIVWTAVFVDSVAFAVDLSVPTVGVIS